MRGSAPHRPLPPVPEMLVAGLILKGDGISAAESLLFSVGLQFVHRHAKSAICVPQTPGLDFSRTSWNPMGVLVTVGMQGRSLADATPRSALSVRHFLQCVHGTRCV
jgi:hypothetical protein